MIFAQRPDATACAAYDLWNERMGRYVKRGGARHCSLWTTAETDRHCGMSLTSPTPVPGGEERAHPGCGRWKEPHLPAVTAALEQSYEIPGDAGLVEQLEIIARDPVRPVLERPPGRMSSTSLTDRSWRRMMTIPSASNFALSPPSAWPTPCYPAAALPRRKSCTMRTSCPSSTSTPPATIGALGTASAEPQLASEQPSPAADRSEPF